MWRTFPFLERLILVLLALIVLSSSWYLYGRYVRDHSQLIPTVGGIYTEGVIGRPQFLNPVLLTGNPVDEDISRLIFSGLSKFNPHTGDIEDDLATSEISKDNLTYTFTLVPDAYWHDGTPVTADDVMYTYQDVIQNENFPGASLRALVDDVDIRKVDERTVTFRLKEPYSFFLANVTVGLLPKHILEFVPVDNMKLTDFNQNPIGTGPYRFSSWSTAQDTHEVTLSRNENYYATLPKIQTFIFRSFLDRESLLLSENTLRGFRYFGEGAPGDYFGVSNRYRFYEYSLPQYSAVFQNTESEILSNKKVRFALLLATDKEAIRDAVSPAVVVDTPVLESKDDLDIEYSLERSMGAFFDTEWNIPSKAKKAEEEAAEEDDSSGGPELDKLLTAPYKYELKAAEDTWMTVSLDGGSKTSFLFSTGQERNYTVQNSLTFSTIGNAAGLTGTVNGVRLKSFGKSGVVVRGLTLSPDNLDQYVDESSVPAVPVDAETEVVDDADVDPVVDEETDTETEAEAETEEESAEESPIPEEVKPSDELDKVRINDEGKRLIIRLVTAQEQPEFLKVAEMLQEQWLEAGAKIVIETYPLLELQDKIRERDYDILLFGQNLGYNLDAFPFWHSSQAENGLNLSSYRSLEADNLLVEIRKTFDERTKQELLDKLKRVIAEDTPAVFLYNPLHTYVVQNNVKNIELPFLSNHSDRFSQVSQWYINEEYELTTPFSFSGLFNWIFTF